MGGRLPSKAQEGLLEPIGGSWGLGFSSVSSTILATDDSGSSLSRPFGKKNRETGLGPFKRRFFGIQGI